MEITAPSLAPASGIGIGRMIAERLLADPTFLETMCAVAKRGLNAMTHRWIAEDKCTVEVPDMKVQVQTFALLLAHMEGEPIKRIIHQHLGGAGGVDPLAALQESPALREAARALLEKADWRTSGHQASKRPRKVKAERQAPIDAQSSTPEPAGEGF